MSDRFRDFRLGLPPELRAAEDVIVVADQRKVTVIELLEVLREQLAIDSTSAHRRSLRHDGPDGLREMGLIANAWRQITFGQARAVVTLLEEGLELEAQVNTRVALEHAVFLRQLALAVDDNKMGAFVNGLERQMHEQHDHKLTYLESLEALADVAPAVRDALREARTAHDTTGDRLKDEAPAAINLRFVRRVFWGTPGGEHLYDAYRYLSENVHAGMLSAMPYLKALFVTEDPLLPNAPAPTQWATSLALLCWACWAADDAMQRFLDVSTDEATEPDAATRHQRLLARVGLTGG